MQLGLPILQFLHQLIQEDNTIDAANLSCSERELQDHAEKLFLDALGPTAASRLLPRVASVVLQMIEDSLPTGMRGSHCLSIFQFPK